MRTPLEVFSEQFTAIAFDTLGFGLSDLLPLEQPSTEDLADALAETLTTLGIRHAAVYGRHTGAQIAVEFAARHPERCAMALTDGFPIYTAEEKAKRLASYLPPIVPTFDGSHLIWIWFRYRDQHVFWPWNAQDLAHRADTDVPDVEFLHRGVIEMLEAGDAYRIGYATAYRHRGQQAFADLRVPVCFGGRPGDSQSASTELMPPGTWTQKIPRDAAAAVRAECKVLMKHPAEGDAPPAPACTALPGRSTPDYLEVDGAQILVRSVGDVHTQPPVVVIHRLPGSSALYETLICEIGKSHPVLAPDLPGHGESDTPLDGAQNVTAWPTALIHTLDRMDIPFCHLYGHNGGAAVAVEAARRWPERVISMVLDAPICLSEAERDDISSNWLRGVEPVTPTWDGSHLLRVWHMRRDMELWWPWFERNRQNARDTEPRIDPASLTLEVREIMKQPASFVPTWRALMPFHMRFKLAETTQPCLLIGAPADIFYRCLPEARAARQNVPKLEIGDSDAARAKAIVGFVQTHTPML